MRIWKELQASVDHGLLLAESNQQEKAFAVGKMQGCTAQV